MDSLHEDSTSRSEKCSLYPRLSEDTETGKELLGSDSEGDRKDEDEDDSTWLPVLLSVLAVSFGCFIQGSTIVFADIALAGIKNSSDTLVPGTNHTELGYKYDETVDKSWIMGIAAFGMMAGGLSTGPLINSLGRRLSVIIGVSLVFGVSYILFLVAIHVSFLYIARFLAGFGLGISQAVSTIYIAEISTPKLRSNMAVIPAMAGGLGVFSCQLVAYISTWRQLATIYGLCNVPLLVMCAAMPESPVYLIAKNKEESAFSALRKLRGPRWNVSKEVADIRRSIQSANTGGKKISIHDWVQPSTIKPLLVAFTLMFFFQMSGINIMLQYAITVFGQVGNLDMFLSQILLGCALFASNTLTLIIAGKLPRRVMLLACSLGLSISLAVMGVCYQIDDWQTECFNEAKTNNSENEEIELTLQCSYGLGLLPIVTAMVYIFMFNIGYGSLVFMTAAEILPAHIRSSTNGLTICWTGFLSFMTTFSFPYLLNSRIKGQGCFWMYSAVSFVGFLFIGFFVPETGGKTEAEISALFQKNSQKRFPEPQMKMPPPSPIIKKFSTLQE